MQVIEGIETSTVRLAKRSIHAGPEMSGVLRSVGIAQLPAAFVAVVTMVLDRKLREHIPATELCEQQRRLRRGAPDYPPPSR
jgi:hypothetical protein